MTGHHAAKLLEDILRWRLQEWTPIEQVSAIRYDQDVVQGHDDQISLPFGLDSVIDSVDSDGAVGVCDAESIDKALRFWTPWFSDWVDQPPIYRDQPGAWMLQQLQENPVFGNVDGWHLDETGDTDQYGLQCQTAWDDYCEALKIIHHKVARATGNAPLNRGLCPKCKAGNMLSPALHKTGFAEDAICSNTTCATTIHYQPDEAPNSVRAALRDENVTDQTWLTLQQLRKIWPNLKKSTMTKWARDGHIRRNGHNQYNLHDTNKMLWTRIRSLVS